jgi:tetratricopeptide (TPR) repeat protein
LLRLGRAIVLYRQGRIDDSAETAEAAAEEATALGNREALANAFYIRAAAEGDRGGPAGDFLDRALPIFEELGLLHRQATVLNNMGVRAFYEGRWDDAVSHYLRAAEVSRRAGDVLTGGHTTTNHGELLLHRGRLEEAEELLQAGLRTYRAATFPIGEALVLVYLGHLAAEQRRFADAYALLDDASERLSALGSKSFLIEADARRAQAYVLEGRHGEAAELAQSCLDRMQETGEAGVRAAMLERLLALAVVQARRPEEAAPHFAESLRLGREFGADYEVARTLQAKLLTGFADDAELEEAEAIMERLGVVSFPDVPLP